MATKHSERGWQVGKTLSQCNSYMFDNQVACDIKFSIQSPDGSTVTVPAHKYMLVSRSPVFEAMLCGPGEYIEAKGDVVIIDIEPDIFKGLLRFIYTGDTLITAENVLHIMAAAKKYIVDALVEKCAEFLDANINTENACTILNHAVLLSEEEITEKCIQFIAPRSKQILTTESFLEISQTTLTKILQCDDLEVDNEMIVLDACTAWARNKCKQTGNGPESDTHLRTVVGDSYLQIRFTFLKPDHMLKLSLCKILSDKEFRLVSMCCLPGTEFEKQKEYGKEQLASNGFNISPRKASLDRIQTVNRIKEVQATTRWKHQGRPDAIGFTLSRAVEIVGVSVFSSPNVGDVHSCTLEIYDDIKRQWIGKTSTSLTSNGTDQKQNVMLESPVTLQAGMGHAIKVTLVGPECYKGVSGIREVTADGTTFTFENHTASENGTGVNFGQIPDIIFKCKSF